MRLKASLMCAVLMLTGCGGGSNPDNEITVDPDRQRKLGGLNLEVLSDPAELQFGGNQISGRGKLRSAETLASFDSGNNFTIRFALQPRGDMALHVHTRKDLGAGIDIIFARGQEEDKSLSVIARSRSKTVDFSSRFTAVDVSGTIEVSIDLHNDHGENPHVMMWLPGMILPTAQDSLLGQPRDLNWGFTLHNATLFSAVKADPRSED